MFPAGQRVPCPGGSGGADRAMYILLRGRVDVYKASAAGGTQTVGTILPGDVFGGREFFTDADDLFYAAGADAVVYLITEAAFNELSWTRPEILFEIFRAAYTPMRKMTASQKSSLDSGVAGAGTGVLEGAARRRTAGKSRAQGLGRNGSDSADTRISAKERQEAMAAALMEEPHDDIFPEGHKHYPGVTRPEYAKLVFPKVYTCPYCKKPFKEFKIFRSKLYEASPMRFDLRRYYTDFQPEWYEVLTCHNCLFSTFHNYFTEPKPLQKVKIDKQLTAARASILLDFDVERDINLVFAMHYLAILCSDGYLSPGRQIRAKLWGNLSWLYEDVEDEEMAKFAAAKAAEAYEAVYAETRLTPVQEQVTCLSIAGMQYRAGVDRNMRRFLFTAKTSKAGDRSYSKVAEDFMYELKLGVD